MKFAFISESPADEAALHAFCETLIARPLTRITSPVRVPGGWQALMQRLPPALRAIRYKTEADIVVVTIDSDGSDLMPDSPTNRFSQLQEIITQNLAPPPPPIPPIPTASRHLRAISGIAVPAIEAWWLAHKYPEISETAWLERRKHASAYDKLELKRRLYGTERPALSHETRRMVCAAREAARNPDMLSKKFPQGLATLIREIRALVS
jgi:hypothetical protein